MDGCGRVGRWVGTSQMTNNGINLDLIEMGVEMVCLKTYGWVETPPPVGVCDGWLEMVGGWVNGCGDQVKWVKIGWVWRWSVGGWIGCGDGRWVGGWVWTHGRWVCGWVCGWLGGSVDQWVGQVK